jgi:hypothetical protein
MSTDDVAERHAAAEDERVRLGLLERHEKAVRERERARERRRDIRSRRPGEKAARPAPRRVPTTLRI